MLEGRSSCHESNNLLNKTALEDAMDLSPCEDGRPQNVLTI